MPVNSPLPSAQSYHETAAMATSRIVGSHLGQFSLAQKLTRMPAVTPLSTSTLGVKARVLVGLGTESQLSPMSTHRQRLQGLDRQIVDLHLVGNHLNEAPGVVQVWMRI